MKQHVYPLNDSRPHVTDGGHCPCEPSIDGDVVIHNAWDGRDIAEREAVWAALLNEEITMSRAAELLEMPFIEVREECNRRLAIDE